MAVSALVLPATAHAIEVPGSADSGRIQQKYSGEKPQILSTDKPLIQNQQETADLKNAGEISFVLGSVHLEGNTVFSKDELAKFYADKIGKKVTLADMYAVRDEITKYYREKGYVLSRAVVPAQKLGKGNADFKIRIVEGYINSVTIQGEFKGDRDILNNYIEKIKKAGPLNSNDLERYLLLINDLAGTTANAVLKAAPGKGNTGASDLVITTDHDYVNGLASFDNSGTKYIGRHLFSAEANLNSALGLSEKISARGILSANTNELKFGDIAYQMPIGYEGTKFKILAGHTITHPGSTLRGLGLEGTTDLFELTLTHPFIRSRKENLSGRVLFDIKNTNTDADEINLYDDKTRTMTLGGTYDLADSWNGVNLVDISGTQGFDILDATDNNNARSRANGSTVFTKFNFQASRLQTISGPLGVLFAASGQYSFDPLLAGDEFGIGGVDFGRGYDFSEITGDQGLDGKIEIQYGIDVDSSILNSLQLYTFYDAGAVWQRAQLAGEKGKSSLTSVGLGTRFNLFNTASGYVELAKPLTRKIASEGDDAIQIDFGISYLF